MTKTALAWVVIGDLSPNRGTVVSVHVGDSAGETANGVARRRRDRDVIYRPVGEAPAVGERVVRHSWSAPRGAA